MEIDVALQGKAGLPVWEAGLDTFRWSTRRDDAERETEREREREREFPSPTIGLRNAEA
jgi:hypothetical protein